MALDQAPATTGHPIPTAPHISQASKAGFHAREASRLLASLVNFSEVCDEADATVQLATAHALTSLAWVQQSPPARRRPPAVCRPVQVGAVN